MSEKRSEHEVNDWIDSSLQRERRSCAPLFFHRKMEQSLRFVAIRDAESQRFRYSVMGLMFSLLALPLIAGGLVILFTGSAAIRNSFPGLRGKLDYYLTTSGLGAWQPTSETLWAVGLGLLVFVVLLGLFPLRNRILS